MSSTVVLTPPVIPAPTTPAVASKEIEPFEEGEVTPSRHTTVPTFFSPPIIPAMLIRPGMSIPPYCIFRYHPTGPKMVHTRSRLVRPLIPPPPLWTLDMPTYEDLEDTLGIVPRSSRPPHHATTEDPPRRALGSS
ncbi:hypothetical protein CTI12_AA420690 [Artemisia annua]|uniref:Uncharacterized protein n=1 Tax=Artemisia annua TaxID=35608 RepID=A0A2U1M523_ARTAN|nr:hypothetical protein CTI12_AA420690 [Artemisia annua]